MSVAVDSSFLVSCYILDAYSEIAVEHRANPTGDILVNPLTVLEINNALQTRVFRGQNTEEESRQAMAAFEADLASGEFRQVPLPDSIWATARKLTRIHTPVLGVRSLDILHVAAALALKADSFLTFDERQARLARAEGLPTPLQA